MSQSSQHHPVRTVYFLLEDLPPFQGNLYEETIPQIVAYFRHLLEAEGRERDEAPFVLIPPPYELEGFFQCPELYIFEALDEMGKEAYDYEIRGLDCPIVLRDPLNRQPMRKCQGKTLRGNSMKWPGAANWFNPSGKTGDKTNQPTYKS